MMRGLVNDKWKLRRARVTRQRMWPMAGVIWLAGTALLSQRVDVVAENKAREYVASLRKVMPPAQVALASCPPEGRASTRRRAARPRIDTVTDLLKNRVQEGAYQSVTVEQILALPGKSGLPTNRYLWSRLETDLVARYEGAPVVAEGYLAEVRLQGREVTNCEIADPVWHDWHVWLVSTRDESRRRDKRRSIVVEVTPRVRLSLPPGNRGLNRQQILMWVERGQHVRIKGWLMFDPDHPNEVGKSRGTTWEIHPVMWIEPLRQ